MKHGYLGIDESNHGIVPEVFVGVFSSRDSDVARDRQLHKKRTEHDLSTIVRGRPFRHIIISEKDKQILGPHGIRIVAFAELIRFFSVTYGLDQALIDGDLQTCDAREIENVLYPVPIPRIQGIAHADMQYPLVNIADRAAYHLAQYYTRQATTQQKEKADQYIATLLTPRLERYGGLVDMLKEQGRHTSRRR